ncbi:MAG: TolC family protein [Fusobacterium sp.]|nr:TolC family protein [Fusobacterium sp.]
MVAKKFLIILINLLLLAGSANAYELNLEYWENYQDPYLTGYLRDLYDGNQDLKIAKLNSLQAQDNIKMQFSNQLPYLGFSGSYNWAAHAAQQQFGQLVIPDYHQYNLLMPVAMSYEVDIWGKNYLKTKSVKMVKEMIEQDERSAYISITSNFAGDYYNLIKINRLLSNMKEIHKIELDLVAKMEKKYACGLATITDVLTEKQELANIEMDLNLLEKDLELIKDELMVQLGNRNLREFETLAYDEVKPFDVPQEIPSESIQDRPDLIKTEFYIKKIGIDVKVARREFLPKFTLFGQFGFNAYSFARLFAPETVLGHIGVMPQLDLFTGGAKKANLNLKKHEYKKALEYYEKTILTSLQELNDALVSLKTCKANYDKDLEKISLEREKYRLTQRQLEIGAISEFDELVARKYELKLEQELVNQKINYVISTINLYKALGGKNYLHTPNL